MKKIIALVAPLIVVPLIFGLMACNERGKDPNEPIDPNEKNIFDKYVKQGVIKGVSLREKLVLPASSYVLDGALIVEEGGELVIEPGTIIKANKGFDKYILVARGGKIMAQGTADKPITFTANATYANKANEGQGHWGGILLNGYAPISHPVNGKTEGKTEINNAYAYGGDNEHDNSGVLKYVVIAYGGASRSEEVEHNGLTLNAVGDGTTIENVYVLNSADDAIEFFGGTVNVKNLLAVNPEDDMFDFTQGYSGTLENCYGIWEEGYYSGEKDPRGVEADGNLDGKNKEYDRQSFFTIRNMTIELNMQPKTNKETDHGYFMDDVIKIRRECKVNIENALVKGTGSAEDLIDLTDKVTNAKPGCIINVTNKLSSKLIGKEVRAIDAKQHTINISDGNTGCNKDLFKWTGYKIK